MRRHLLVSLLVGAFAASIFGADLYVSPSGSDDAAGTSAAPLATIAKARDKADELKASGPVTVNLMGGTYYLSAPVIFTATNSGTAAAPIVYQSAPNEKAVISGGIKLPSTTTWTAATVNGVGVQKTTIEKNLHVDQLFLDGKRQILARYPDYNFNTKVLNGNAADALAKAKAAADPAEGPGYVRAIHNGGWGGNDFYFINKTTTQWVGDNNRGGGTSSMMAENVFEFLNAPGEWFYRKSTGELWFYPPTGTDLSKATIELASISQLIRFVGTSGTTANSVKYITFRNITFTHTYRSLFDSTGQFYEKITGSDWGLVRKGAVFMQNAENIVIDHCFFDHVGGNGVFISGYNRRSYVTNSVFKGTGANCVALIGLRSSMRCPGSWNDAGSSYNATCPGNDKVPGPKTDDYPSYCVVRNNLMDTLGVFEKQVSGVVFSATEFDTVSHNSIAHMPRAGINFCDGCWGGTVVDYNWVYDCVRETSDHGPFNAWGRDRNLIYGSNDAAATYYDARNPTIVRMNRFEVPAGMFGIDLDDQASNYYQEKNLVLGGGFKVQWTRGNKYINNISTATNNGVVQFHGTWGSASQPSYHYGARNIIYATSTCVYQFCCGSNPTQVAGTKTVWDSNMVYSTAGQPNCSDWNACNSGNFAWSAWTGAGLDAHSTIANPTWTNTAKTWSGRTPEYLPVGDYNPTNTTAMNAIKFQTFPMDSFGIIGVVPGLNSGNVSISDLRQHDAGGITQLAKNVGIKYSARSIEVNCAGEYRLSVTTVAGRTLAIFQGKGTTTFPLHATVFGSGIYCAVVKSPNGVVAKRFVVSR
jgi:hypothetical protein